MKRTIALTSLYIMLASVVFAADDKAVVNDKQLQQIQSQSKTTEFMLMLGANTAITDKPAGIKIGVLAKGIMVQVDNESGNCYHINTSGWIKAQGLSGQAVPFKLMIGKKTDVFANPGNKDEIATMANNISVDIVEIKDGFARINISGWLLKPGEQDKAKEKKQDPYADLKDGGNSVIDIIDNRIVHDPHDSLSR